MPPKRYSAKRSSQAAPSQSQAPRPSQVPRTTQAPRAPQASGSLTQRRRRVIEEEDEDDEPEQEGGENGEGDEGGEAELERRIALLVRLALSVEHAKGSLRRDQINKIVFPNGGRTFNAVLRGANHNLRKVFGLEMVELMTRAERDKVGAGEGEDEDDDERTATGRKKNKGANRLYFIAFAVLTACISSRNADLSAAGDLDLERLNSKNKTVNPDEEETVAAASRAGTSILGWDVGGEGEGDWYSVMSILLGLILVNGRSVADNTLRALIKPLGLTPNAEMFVPISNHRRRMKFPEFLAHLTKLGYLERARATLAMAGTQQPKKRGRQSQAAAVDDDDDGSAIEWKWGSRAHAEMGEKAVAEFMVDFMVERAIKDAARQLRRNGQTQGGDEDEEDEEANVGRTERNERAKDKAALEARAEKMREAMMRDVERSAGGHLSDAGKGVPTS
ncbi:MAGE domain-containing protein [Rhizoctonia solani AG-1 IA]|uniref:MAGE domain-containing protein n=1 Tax=Thanatephorus cucumeris (strain AG1-IA) TaxID=983506 RepID=L8WUM2_THACA|nr:MAGE domain-containing protein [Rhizoctonia solani AG-1 IA]